MKIFQETLRQVKSDFKNKKFDDVINLARSLVNKYPENFEGYKFWALALSGKGKFLEANEVLLDGIEKLQNTQGIFLEIEYVKLAEKNKSWQETLKRAKLFIDKYPEKFEGYRLAATAHKELGNFFEADKYIVKGLESIKDKDDEQWLLAEYAKIAQRFKYTNESKEGCLYLKDKYPDSIRQANYLNFSLSPQVNIVSKQYQEPFYLQKSYRPTAEDLCDWINFLDYDVISFDIFDTAIFRKVDLPQDIFTILALEMNFPDFLNVRKQAENRARVRQNIKSGTREIIFDEIWDILEQEYGIDSKWKERELELELEAAVENPYIKQVYQKLRCLGKTVVFMTDMYLTRDTIEQLLKKTGYVGYDDLIISNEHGLRKGEGTLQPLLMQKYPDKKIIHIGDNFPGDVEKTHNAGMDAYHNIDQRRLRNEYMLGRANMGSSFYRALINNTTNNGVSKNKSIQYQHGFRVGGILAAGYCEFINSIAHKNNCDKILFLARDCAILHRIYNQYYCEFDNEYVAISRNSILGISGKQYFHDYIGRSVIRQLNNQRSSATVEEIFKETGFEFLIDKLEDYDIEKYLFPQSITRLGEKMQEFFYKEQDYILQHKQRNVEAAKKYFANIIGKAQNVLIVDIGWTGTCISALEHFLAENFPKSKIKAYGSLLCTSRNETVSTALASNVAAYLYTPDSNMDLTRFLMEGRRMTTEERDLVHMPLEYLFTSKEGSLVDYEFEPNGEVYLQRTSFSPENPEEIQQMQDGMYDFCGMYENYRSLSRIPVKISPYLALGPLKEAIENKEYCKEVYGNFFYDATFPMYGDISKKTIFADLFPVKYEILKNDKDTFNYNKKILFVSPEMLYVGAPKSLLRIATVAKSAGYFVEVWTAKSGLFMQEFAKEGIEVKVITPADLTKDGIKKLISSFDVAICNTIVTDAYVRAFNAQNIPVAWYIREATNIPDFCNGIPQRLETLETTKGIVCVSDYAAKAIAKFTTMPIRVTHNAVEDESSFALPHSFAKEGKVKFIQMGTIEYRKGYDIFIQAYKHLPENYKKRVELYFAGGFINSGTPFASYVFSEIKNEDNIHFLGQIRDNQKKIEIMSQMDAIVVASRDESCSLVALEGAMLSKPLIVTENVGAKYMVTDNNGLVIQSGSVLALRDAFMNFVDRAKDLENMGKVSRQIYDEKASMSAHSRDIVSLIEDTVANAQQKEEQADNVEELVSVETASTVLSDVKLPNDRIIISLTSHPPRIPTITQSISSLLNQKMKADRVVLYLAKEQFPEREKELPDSLLELQEQGLEIIWCDEDLKPHKKYWYIMKEEPDAIIIIVDDDVIYEESLVENLYSCYLKNNHSVICTRANLMLFKPNGEFRTYDNWVYDYKARKDYPTYRLLATGKGGVLYPPKSVPMEAFDMEAVKENCLFADDLWLKIMTTLNGYPTVLSPIINNIPEIEGTQQIALWNLNTRMGGNDKFLSNILNYIDAKYGLKKAVMQRMRSIGKNGEWIGKDDVSFDSLLFLIKSKSFLDTVL